MRLQQLPLATSVAALLLRWCFPWRSRAAERRKRRGSEMPASINQQFQWEDKVVGPKEGLGQRQGRGHPRARPARGAGAQNEGPEKVKRVVAEPASATLPTKDIEKPAAPIERKEKKVAPQAPKQRDALDNLLDEQGVKPNRPSGGSSCGLDSVFASDDKRSKGKKASRARHAPGTVRRAALANSAAVD